MHGSLKCNLWVRAGKSPFRLGHFCFHETRLVLEYLRLSHTITLPRANVHAAHVRNATEMVHHLFPDRAI